MRMICRHGRSRSYRATVGLHPEKWIPRWDRGWLQSRHVLMSCGDDRLIRMGPRAIQSRVNRFASARKIRVLKARELGHLAIFHLRPEPPGPPVSYFFEHPSHAPADPPVLMMGLPSKEVGLSIAKRVDRHWQSSSDCRASETCIGSELQNW